MFRLTRDDLLHIAPRPRQGPGAQIWDAYVAALTSPQAEALMASLTNERRLANALAQMCCETNFSIFRESGAYSWERIVEVFGPGHHSAAIGEIEARRIASLPISTPDGRELRGEALFERVYGLGNPHKAHELGNTQKGDGYKYRGWGLNQLTGGAAIQAQATKLGIPVDQMLASPLASIAAFMFEWEREGCNAYADRDDTISIRKIINGGSVRVSITRINGLPEAMAAVRRAKSVITAADFSSAPAPTEDIATNLPAINPDKPVSLMMSTEMQGSTAVTGGSGYEASNQWFDVLPRAFGRATETGRFSLFSFVLALLSDPVFYGAIAASGLTAVGIYLMIQRFKRYFVHGV